MKRKLSILLIILLFTMMFLSAEADTSIPMEATAYLKLTPDTAADFEIGFSSVEIKDHGTVPQPLLNGIVLESEYNGETETVSASNDLNATWFYWKILSPYPVVVTLEADSTDMSVKNTSYKVGMTVSVIDDSGEETNGDNLATDGNVFFSKKIEGGLNAANNDINADSYRISVTVSDIPLSDIHPGTYEGNIKVTIGAV